MPTFVSMLTWYGDPQPRPGDVRAAIDARSPELRAAGLHSVVFLPEEGACAAVMIASCADADAIGLIAASVCPEANVRVESMQFDDAKIPAWIGREALPPPPADYLAAVFEAVVTE